MSYNTPIETTTAYRGIEKKLQDIAAAIKPHLSWLEYSFGLADRFVETREKKEYIFPAVYQDINSKDPLSVMPSDLHKAFSFWVKGPEGKFDVDNPAIAHYGISVIFYCDLKKIAPTDQYRLTRTKIRQDILQAFREHHHGFGVIQLKQIIEDDLTKIYDGFSVEQVDNKYKMLPKYAIRLDFDYSFIIECQTSYNTYA